MDLVFQLERGGTDAFRRLPVVWRVDEAFDWRSLQRRFAEGWIDWFGPGLRPHAQAIAAQLARAAMAPGRNPPQATARGVPVPRWWAMPVVRRRNRRLRLCLSPPAAGHGPGWPLSGPGSVAVEPDAPPWQLDLCLHQFWGAASDQAFQPGPAVWRNCSERRESPSVRLPGLVLWHEALKDFSGRREVRGQRSCVRAAEEGAPCVEHLLHDGIGLIVLVPELSSVAGPPQAPLSDAAVAGAQIG